MENNLYYYTLVKPKTTAERIKLPAICASDEYLYSQQLILRMSHISLLPEEILLQILPLLSSKDILNLSIVSSYFYTILNQEKVWRKVLRRENLTISKHVLKFSTQKKGHDSLPPSKLKYLVEKKLHQNWMKGSSKKTSLENTYDNILTNILFTKSDDHIAIVDNSDRSVRIVDLCTPEPKTLINWKLKWDRRVSIIFVLEAYLVLGYFDEFSLSLKTFSLSSFALLWESRNTIDCTNLMTTLRLWIIRTDQLGLLICAPQNLRR